MKKFVVMTADGFDASIEADWYQLKDGALSFWRQGDERTNEVLTYASGVWRAVREDGTLAK